MVDFELKQASGIGAIAICIYILNNLPYIVSITVKQTTIITSAAIRVTIQNTMPVPIAIP